nr:phosphotransferase family protein [Chloroflexota bacterium]
MTTTIEQVIAVIPAWAGRAVHADRIAAGLTNQNWRVVVDGVPHFVRIPGAATDLLSVDRANERHNTRAAAEAGVGPPMLHEIPAWDVFVLAWVEARTMSSASLAAPGMPTRIGETLRQLHAGPRFRDDFDMFRLAERYLQVVDERRIAIPDGYRERMSQLPALEAALAVHPLPSVPCHNDLLAENYLDDGDRLWIVDYEYSGNGDPTFELGNTCQEQGWDDARIRELCAAYFGEATEALLARMRLQMIMSDVGWTLWAAIQDAVSPIDFDFWSWGMAKYERAVQEFDGPDLDRLLDE